MRGKARFSKMSASVSRITPAYAGKSAFSPSIWYNPKDHPRLCGEKFWWSSQKYSYQGITPAYAGKSIEAAETVFKG